MVSDEKATQAIRKILDYIQKNLDKGYKLEDLRWALISQGYSKFEVEKAMVIMKEKISKEKVLDLTVNEVREKEPEFISEEDFNVSEKKKGFFKRLFI
jgi:hypothetical protein